MPHLTLPLTAEGCAVTLYVNVSRERVDVLRAAGKDVPSFITLRALIDTGATCTAIDAAKLTPLGMTPTDISQIVTPSSGGTPVPMPQYDAMLGIAHPTGDPLLLDTVPIVAIPNFAQGGIEALVGRDVLSKCLLVYNGTENNFTLSF